MEDIENLLQIIEQLGCCTNPDELETLKKSLKGSIHIKKRRKESDLGSCKNGGSKELGIRNMGKSRMSSVTEESREVDYLIKEVDNLIKEAKALAVTDKFGDDKFPTRNLVGEKFYSYMNKILDLLIKNEASTIGVWGMGGVGKTTLIRHLQNMMRAQPHIYDFIYWIKISKDCSIQKLQTDIAEKIGESISDELDESKRAGILAEALKRKKKFIVILDDMWSNFDLNEVGLGIPKEIGYQLIVTSRSKDVCLKMYCDNIIKVDPLSKNDAWTLFVRSIGSEISDDLTKIINDVIKECAGLPLGITTLAKSMINCNDVYEWRYVLEELRNSSGEETVWNVLRLSYERLKDRKIKECLLYCAKYSEAYPIEITKLILLFIDEGLLGKNVGLIKMFDKGLTILKKLERATFLSMEGDKVYLHDLIRDMTVQIAGSRFMIKADIKLRYIPDEKSWTGLLELVSLKRSKKKEISDSSPKCTRNDSLSMVCDGSFRHWDELKLLELSDSKIRTLPESISLLKNLTALILRNCQFLQHVPSLAKLTSLERLDLNGTRIRQLPEGIGSLIKLRYLNLLNTLIIRIGVGVISKLIALQYLAIDATIEIKELNSLNNLEHLNVKFEDFVSFSTFIEQMKNKGRPNSYIFVFGNENLGLIDDMSNQGSEKHIYLRKIYSLTHGDNDMTILVDQYNKLLMILFGNHNTSLGYSFSKSRNNLQRSAEIERRTKLFCENEVQKLVQDIQLLDIDGGGDLMSLGDFVINKVCNLQRQDKIKGGLKPFSNLKHLRLYSCPKLKKLFPLGLLSNLQNIEEIDIGFCEGLEELIEDATNETELRGIRHHQIFSLPQLRLLHLFYLPNLKTLCSDNNVIRTPSLQTIGIKGCKKLKRMPLDVDNHHQLFPHMVYSTEDKNWVKLLEWKPLKSKALVSRIESNVWE